MGHIHTNSEGAVLGTGPGTWDAEYQTLKGNCTESDSETHCWIILRTV